MHHNTELPLINITKHRILAAVLQSALVIQDFNTHDIMQINNVYKHKRKKLLCLNLRENRGIYQ